MFECGLHEYEIICIVHDNDGIITYVGLKGQSTMSVPVVTRLINDGTHSFYVYRHGHKAQVYARTPNDGNPFLTIDPESTHANDLDFMPVCP